MHALVNFFALHAAWLRSVPIQNCKGVNVI
jgi:hypothetical protein